jgi:hypothetical protein
MVGRVIFYAFFVPASAFVTQVNRATSQTLRTAIPETNHMAPRLP